MSDESTNSPTPDADPSKRSIKIGSQRPGYMPEVTEKKPVEPVVPTPVHRHIASDPNKIVTPAETPAAPEATAPPVSATPASASPVSTPEPPVAESPDATAPDAIAPVGALPSADSPAAETSAPAEASEPASADVVESDDKIAEQMDNLTADAVKMPAVDLEMSDEDLEKEIAAAMGAGIGALLDEQVQVKPDEVEIEFDERYSATVINILRDSVFFELPGQRNGYIQLKHFEENPEPGTQVEVIVTGFSPAEDLYELMIPGGSVSVADWSDIQEGVVVQAKITGHNKGGLECELNSIRGFIPAGQISIYRIEDFSAFVDKTLQCVVIEANEERRNLVLSHRAVLEREREVAKEKLMAELEVGQIREGTVTRLQKFGAFVDLGGVDGLIHISQLSWDNIRDPSEVVKEGQLVKVRVEKVDAETGRIGLSYRDLMHHPWEGIEGKYPVGDVVTGTVSKLMDFGAFVKLEPGIEGLVHISELSHKRVNRVSHVVEEGQRVEVKILSVDADSQRVALSIKAAAGEPADAAGAGDETDEPVVKHVPKVPQKSLKGGTGKGSGGEQFGLKW